MAHDERDPAQTILSPRVTMTAFATERAPGFTSVAPTRAVMAGGRVAFVVPCCANAGMAASIDAAMIIRWPERIHIPKSPVG